ncbi:MAG TPA: heterodisulfide reductase-related iron-sulfur binding cluster, partial [Pyrinomonadaceae bacterium]|nr:heterodisulfide reductase-related iron-sulfur binding cluster [Pyrinomonadaceae bacterium]
KLLACVHCGLCLEACPTYVATGDENDSPRGRIYLMRAVEEGRLDRTSETFERHLNRCLGCRACEAACPAGVQYGQLLEAGRAELARAGERSGWTSRMLRLVLRHIWLHPKRLRIAFSLARILRDAALARLLLKSRIPHLISRRAEFALALLESSSSATSAKREISGEAGEPVRQSAPEVRRSKALLFTGCVTEGLFAHVNGATRRVLEANGCDARALVEQVCCGALHAHAGDMEGARNLARRNIEAFDDDEEAAIVTNAGGCGAMLVSYDHIFANDSEYSERARKFSSRVRDIGQQLESTGIRAGASVEEKLTTYDTSCHLLYGQHAGDASLKMLLSVPGLQFVPLTGSEVCCGGAGVYNLLEAEMSGRVLDEKLRHVEETKAELIATGNPGCHMQIGAGLLLRGEKTRICHPVEILDESYRRAGFYVEEENTKALNLKSEVSN